MYRDIILSDALITVLAILPIYTGSLYSVKYLKELASTTSHIDMEEVKYIPLLLSITLISLYFLIKFFLEKYVSLLLGIYFALVSFYSIVDVLCSIYYTVMKKSEKGSGHRYSLEISLSKKKVTKDEDVKVEKKSSLEVTFVEIVAGIISICLVSAYTYTKNWILSNIIAECLCFLLLTSLKLDSFKTALVLLVALLATDVFWVFATDVMIIVAKSLDLPIKIIVPRNIYSLLFHGSSGLKAESKFSFLGLGDIAIPGVFISFCLIADLIFHEEKTNSSKTKGASGGSQNKSGNMNFEKPYFHIAILGYAVGLIAAYCIATTFNTGQPALLYLVPSTMIPVIALALKKGQLKKLYDIDTELYYDMVDDGKKNLAKKHEASHTDATKTKRAYKSTKTPAKSTTRKTKAAEALESHQTPKPRRARSRSDIKNL